jgi:hypothetical protein
MLSSYGLRVMVQPETQPAEQDWDGFLAVANAHANLNRLFGQTHWAARSGAAGVWRQTLARAPDAQPGRPVSFRGIKQRTVMVPLRHVMSLGEDA